MQSNLWFIDQLNRRVEIPFPPKRIVSLVPSQTELLYDLGLENEVVGQTLFCIHPAEFHKTKPRIGGTKKLNLQKIRELQPDLIIGNKEENDQSQVEELMKEFPVWMSDIQNLDQALDMIQKIGDLCHKKTEASQLVQQINLGFKSLVQTKTKKKGVYLIWREPWMAAGKNTFINDLLQRLQIENLAETVEGRYPQITTEWLRLVQPETILLSSEPYPFKEIHLEELRQICPYAQIQLVDGELFSWYGSRLLLSSSYLATLS
ncbi:MAG: helical backbone metal receptor [Bacteroidia bacterium]|nr:helical backbone metal receptor [Bacteroidia bacterium]MCF8428001.1 helical backbone metal receptor [Bacteroidia bacterium]MCF8445725.1 helical backbone metal receptor [Bacteroidia bacterium]